MSLSTYLQSTIGAFLRARFGRTERGASLVEYALLVALIAVVCIVAITFPLVFGWINFGTASNDQLTYVTYVFGFPMGSFRLHTVTALLLFHGLDISALLVLAGIALSLGRRMTDKGARTLQQFGMDFLPVILMANSRITGRISCR